MSRLLQKRTEVAVKGKLNHKSYEDNNGITRYVPGIIVDQFNRFGKAPELHFNYPEKGKHILARSL